MVVSCQLCSAVAYISLLMLIHLRSAVPCNVDDDAAWPVCMRFACSAACYDPAQSVAMCLNLMDSHVQQHVALLMLIHLRSAVPCNVDDDAAWPVCMRFACSAACYDPAQSVAMCLNPIDSHVQQHVALLMFSTAPCTADGSAA